MWKCFSCTHLLFFQADLLLKCFLTGPALRGAAVEALTDGQVMCCEELMEQLCHTHGTEGLGPD
eukprot:jgi/Botrbrau1/18277/Bobra.0179s0011.1